MVPLINGNNGNLASSKIIPMQNGSNNINGHFEYETDNIDHDLGVNRDPISMKPN